MSDKEYIVVVQCDIVKERCSGYYCEKAYNERIGGFSHYSKEKIVVHLSSCITKNNYHGLPCPHIDYMKTLIGKKLGLDICEDTSISPTSEKRRKEGIYKN
jgi:predicted metal-binding protein